MARFVDDRVGGDAPAPQPPGHVVDERGEFRGSRTPPPSPPGRAGAARQDEAFSAVVHLTPEEMKAVADTVRRTLARYQDRELRPSIRPEGARPVAVVTRLFPLVCDSPRP